MTDVRSCDVHYSSACVAHLFVELPLPPLANSLDFGGASPASRPVSPSALSGTVAGAGDSRGFRGGKNRTGVPSAVPAELQMVRQITLPRIQAVHFRQSSNQIILCVSSLCLPSVVLVLQEGVFEAVRQRACDILSDSGVQHCTIQSVPLLPIEALSVDQVRSKSSTCRCATIICDIITPFHSLCAHLLSNNIRLGVIGGAARGVHKTSGDSSIALDESVGRLKKCPIISLVFDRCAMESMPRSSIACNSLGIVHLILCTRAVSSCMMGCDLSQVG